MKVGMGSCMGTFGELVQGIYRERPFLITFPIPGLHSKAVFVPDADSPEITGEDSYAKAIEGCKRLLDRFHITSGGTLHIESNIPVGKGMASSSADIVSAMKAAADSYSLPITEKMISAISIEIEPTDGVMYDGAVAYDYKNGHLLESFGPFPPFLLFGIDTGGKVDTIQFNKRTKTYSEEEKNMLAKAYDYVRKGIHTKDLSFICQAATISAQINQRFLEKPYFQEFKRLVDIYGGGIVTSHSGTVLGILIDPYSPYVKTIYRHVVEIVDQSEESLVLYTFTHRG